MHRTAVAALGAVACINSPMDQARVTAFESEPLTTTPQVDGAFDMQAPVAQSSSLSLRWRAALPVSGVAGVTVDSTTGDMHVLVDDLGLFRVTARGARRVATEIELVGAPAEMTGVAALGGGRFAITVPGVGYVFDLNTRHTEEFFCYEPGGSGGWDSGGQDETGAFDGSEITYAVAYDPFLDQIIAQPTRPGPNTAFLGSWRADVGGQPFTWQQLDRSVAAGGIAVLGAGDYLLGIGSQVVRIGMWQSSGTVMADLASFGVTRITGLEFDARSSTLLVSQDAELLAFTLPVGVASSP